MILQKKSRINMPLEHFIIATYIFVDKYFGEVTSGVSLRTRGTKAALSDVEVITMEIVGEYMGLGSDKQIWAYFKQHWLSYFPKLGCRTSFTRQSANLITVKHLLQERISLELTKDKDLFLSDGFPIPICHIRRYKRSKSNLRTEGAVGYCAAKDEKYFGFKGHILITQDGVTKAIDIAPANIDERDVLPELVGNKSGDLIADKGLIRPSLSTGLREQGMNLHTPLRVNMQDNRPKESISQMMNVRRIVETMIGQLVGRFKIQAIRAKDLWHLSAKIGRKILAHTICFAINKTINLNNPLQLEHLLA
jgi:hypothetical protein